MALYFIRGDKIAALTAIPAKMPRNAVIVGSAAEIETSDLPAARLVALWNALPGIKPVTKFKDRKTAARRLWAAFAQLPRVARANRARKLTLTHPRSRLA